MIALIQRVTQARVTIGGKEFAEIQTGILALIAIEKHDTDLEMQRLAERLTSYRIFPDRNNKMNLSVTDIDGDLLLVPQFTLAADTRRGNRPGFSAAAPPDRSRAMFEKFVAMVRLRHPSTAVGCFGEDMQVSLTNDGPVTFLLRTPAHSGQDPNA
ncbi:MAG: D-aminoacyl-tRNA deacylase [Methylococcaceae bacterium]|nr:D-aminoacyl-tRNA deacylase [Methylococcaceae bacterium]